MTKRLQIAGAFVLAALVTAACGEAAAPTATPAATTTAPPTATTGAGPTAVPQTPTPEPTPGQAGIPAYPEDLIKQYIAEGYLLPGMQAGRGQKPQYGGQATFSNRADLVGADPNDYASISSENMLAMIYNNGALVRPKPDNTFESEPLAAESWTVSEDFKTWTFKLREGVKWHDGQPLTAEDVEFWVEYGVTPPAGRKTNASLTNSGLKDAEVIDQRTIRLNMKDSNPFFLETFSHPSLPLWYPKRLAQPIIDKGQANVLMSDVNFIGLGPYKFDSYQKGSSVKSVKFDQYWEKDASGGSLPYMDGIYYPIIPDTTVAVSAFRAGRIDGTSRGTGSFMNPDSVTNIKKSLGDKAWFFRMPYLGWGLSLNATKPPFNDVRLRQALNLYTDRSENAKLVYGGFALPNAHMHPGSYYWNPDFRNWPGYSQASKAADQAKAKQLVKEGGWEGTAVTITCRDIYIAHCEFGDLTLKGLGLKPSIQVVDTLKNTELGQSGNFMTQLTSFSPTLPNELLNTMVTTNPLNSNKFGDTKIDEYHKKITTTTDPAARRAVVWEAEKYVSVDQAYGQPWSREEAVIAYRTYIKGVFIPYSLVHNNNAHTWTWIDKSAKS